MAMSKVPDDYPFRTKRQTFERMRVLEMQQLCDDHPSKTPREASRRGKQVLEMRPLFESQNASQATQYASCGRMQVLEVRPLFKG